MDELYRKAFPTLSAQDLSKVQQNFERFLRALFEIATEHRPAGLNDAFDSANSSSTMEERSSAKLTT